MCTTVYTSTALQSDPIRLTLVQYGRVGVFLSKHLICRFSDYIRLQDYLKLNKVEYYLHL